MKTANDFAQLAIELRKKAASIKPADHDRYDESKRLIEYHLHAAAIKAQRIAEAMAQFQEPSIQVQEQKGAGQ